MSQLSEEIARYAQTLELMGKINGMQGWKKRVTQARAATTRERNGTIAKKTRKIWASRIAQFSVIKPSFEALLYNKSNPQSIEESGIKRYENPNRTPKVVNEDKIAHIINQAIQCPIRTRHLSKKAYHICIEILQLKNHGIHYEGVSHQLPCSSNITHIRSKSYQVTWVIGTGKSGDNAHVHYLIKAPRGKQKTQIIKDLYKLYLTDRPYEKSCLEIVKDFEAFAVYMAQNYQEPAKAGILHRGQRRFGIGKTAKRLPKGDKQYLHPRFTKEEMVRWGKATEIYRKSKNISFWGRKHWVWLHREQIRKIAEKLHLKYPTTLHRTSTNGKKYSIRLNLHHGGIWIALNSGKMRIYDLEIKLQRKATLEECNETEKSNPPQMTWYKMLTNVLDNFEFPHHIQT